jgi:hypothetical protein
VVLSDELLIVGSAFPASAFSMSIFGASQGRIVDASCCNCPRSGRQWLYCCLSEASVRPQYGNPRLVLGLLAVGRASIPERKTRGHRPRPQALLRPLPRTYYCRIWEVHTGARQAPHPVTRYQRGQYNSAFLPSGLLFLRQPQVLGRGLYRKRS